MRTTLLLATVSLTLALSACGKGGDATNDAGATQAATAEQAKSDPCGVLTGEEVAAITGDKVNELRRWDEGCKYSSNPNDDGIVLIALPSGGADKMKTMRKTAEVLQGMGASVADKGGAGADVANILKRDGSAAPKLGDEAMWGPNTVLAVRSGDAYVEVTPPLMHDPANHSGYPLVSTAEKRTIATKIAEAALAKLK